MAADLIKRGDTVAVPTETVYGLAADATNEVAIERIYQAKGRPSYNPLIVHVGRQARDVASLVTLDLVDQAALTAASIRVADRLIEAFWPGPLTIILPRGKALPARVAGGLATVGFRMPDHSGFLDLIDACGLPLAAPSANRSNRISPTSAEHVLAELNGRIPLILDGGAARVGVESTIVAIDCDGALRLLRPGGTPGEQIAEVAGSPLLHGPSKLNSTAEAPEAPGMLREHYAPAKPLLLIRPEDCRDAMGRLHDLGPVERIAVISFGSLPCDSLEWHLDKNMTLVDFTLLAGSDTAAANQLFQTLRRLDEGDAQVILAEYPRQAESGLLPAIHDRLTRASARWSKPNSF
jgi:L-threonylcarbamoyladenylate synthase